MLGRTAERLERWTHNGEERGSSLVEKIKTFSGEMAKGRARTAKEGDLQKKLHAVEGEDCMANKVHLQFLLPNLSLLYRSLQKKAISNEYTRDVLRH